MNRLRKTRSGDASILVQDNMTSDIDKKYNRRRQFSRTGLSLLLLGVTAWIVIMALTRRKRSSSSYNMLVARRSHDDSSRGMTVSEFKAQRTVSMTESFRGHRHRVTPVAAQQIQNYKRGTALIVNVHFTHHGGTYACHGLGKAAGQTGSPSFACMGLTDDDNVTAKNLPQPERVPWKRENTNKNIELVRPHFHFLNWEFGAPETAHHKRPLADADWENPNLVSIIIMRDPLARLLAIDGWVRQFHPTVSNNSASRKEWMDYATTPHNNTNDFALAILAGKGCCQGKDTSVEHLHAAKRLMSRMTFILDIECLQVGLEEVAHMLGFEAREVERRLQDSSVVAAAAGGRRDLKLHRKWPPPKQRLPPKIYEFLVERNRLDIELYEWSKEISLVRCSDLSGQR